MELPKQEWIVKSAGQIFGPLSLDELVEFLKKRKISIIDEVKGPLSRWSLIREHPELKEVANAIRIEDMDQYEVTGVVAELTRTVTVETQVPDRKEIPVPVRTVESKSDVTPTTAKDQIWHQRNEVRNSKKERKRSLVFGALVFLIAFGAFVQFLSQKKSGTSALSAEQNWNEFLSRSKIGSDQEAWIYLERAAEKKPLNREQVSQAIPVALHLAMTVPARKWIENLLPQDPNSTELKYWLALVWMREGILTNATQELRDLTDDLQFPLNFVKAKLAYLNNDSQQALEVLSRSPQTFFYGKGLLKARIWVQDISHFSESNRRNELLNDLKQEMKNPSATRDALLFSIFLNNTGQDLNEELAAFLHRKWIRSEDFVPRRDSDYTEIQTQALAEDCQRLQERLKGQGPFFEALGAYCSWMKQDYAGGLQSVSELRLRDPQSSLWKSMEAQLLSALGHYSQAVVLLKGATTEQDLLLLANSCLETNDIPCAQNSLDLMAKKDDADLFRLYTFASFYKAKDQKHNAQNALATGLAVSTSYRPFLLMGKEL